MSVTCVRSVFFSGHFGFLHKNGTDHHDITEILLKVALNTMHKQINKQTYSKLCITRVKCSDKNNNESAVPLLEFVSKCNVR